MFQKFDGAGVFVGDVVIPPYYSGSPLTGYLSGTAAGNDVYFGAGLSAAMESLTVVDLVGGQPSHSRKFEQIWSY